MRVMYTTVAQVKTGQMEAAIGLAAESAAIMRRHGADVRLFLSAAAGEQIDTTLMSLEFESPDAMAEAFDSVGEDTEQQAFMARLHSPDAPTVMTNQAMSMVLPIRAPAEGQGGLLEVHTNTVHPGRFEDYVAQSLEVCDFVEANGAVNARVIQLTYAGWRVACRRSPGRSRTGGGRPPSARVDVRRRPPPRSRAAPPYDGRPMPESTPLEFTDEQLAAVTFNADGLVPAVIQEAGTGRVLMMAWMNDESLRRSLETGRTWFWSRSRQEYWCKGETSGDRQFIREGYYDCDGDTLLFVVEQEGRGACHTGEYSCFFRAFGPGDA